MYRQERFDPSDADAFSSRAVWSPEGEGWSGFLPADPQFEIVWTIEGEGIAAAPQVAAPTLSPVYVSAGPSDARVRVHRVRPERARALFGHDAADLAARGRFPLADLGGEWRSLAALSRSSELDAALERIGRGSVPAPDFVRASVAALSRGTRRDFRLIARDAGYSYEQWRRILRRECGVTPQTLATHGRLRRATRLARSSGRMSMDEIAWRAGYADAGSLARAAVRLSGESFRRFAARFTLPD